jgi:hypothetical protein
MTNTPNAKRLTGDDLLALVDSMPRASKTELVEAAGYVSADGRRQFTKLYQALLEARGQALPGSGDGRSGRALSYRTTVLSHGGVLIGQRYVQALGLDRGDHAAIELKKGKLVLSAAD